MDVTTKHLDAIVENINKASNSPTTPFSKREDSRLHFNVGNYHISREYGGVCLYRIENSAGEVTAPIGCGHISKRELEVQLWAFLAGLLAK